jgi:hypothetical protein
MNWDTETGPVWFKNLSINYENYKLLNIKFHVVSGASKMTSGSWVCAYNTNYDEREAERTSAQIAAQKGHATGAIYDKGSGFIPYSAFTNFGTNTPCRSNHNGWAFNLELATTGVSAACSLDVYVTYDLVFHNPQV